MSSGVLQRIAIQMDEKHASELPSVTQYMEAACCSEKSEKDIEFMKPLSEKFQPSKAENMYQ